MFCRKWDESRGARTELGLQGEGGAEEDHGCADDDNPLHLSQATQILLNAHHIRLTLQANIELPPPPNFLNHPNWDRAFDTGHAGQKEIDAC